MNAKERIEHVGSYEDVQDAKASMDAASQALREFQSSAFKREGEPSSEEFGAFFNSPMMESLREDHRLACRKYYQLMKAKLTELDNTPKETTNAY